MLPVEIAAMQSTLILLTLNESEGVKHFASFLQNPPADEVIAVDGGSTDGTVELLESIGIRVVQQNRRGRGEAFRVGVQESQGEHLVFFSPDGNENPDDVALLFRELETGLDMVIASRFLPRSVNEEDGELLPLRKWVNQIFTAIANLIWNRGRPYVSDTINGFRGLTRSAFLAISPESMRFTIEYELSVKAMRMGLKIGEIATHEGQRIGGVSKAISLPVGLDFLRFLAAQIRHDLTAGTRTSLSRKSSGIGNLK